jgi:hypothetical protein
MVAGQREQANQYSRHIISALHRRWGKQESLERSAAMHDDTRIKSAIKVRGQAKTFRVVTREIM